MKKLMPLIIIVVMGMMLYISWSNTNDFKGESARQYKKYIEEAEAFEEKEIYVDAVKRYESALKVKSDDYDTAMKIVSLYEELENDSKYISACNAAIKSDKTNPEPYLLAARKNLELGKNTAAYEVLKKADKTLGELEERPEKALNEISEMIIALKGSYVFMSFDADEYFGLHYINGKTGLAKVRYEENYGLMNGRGSITKKCKYEDINLTANDLTPIKKDGEYYYVDPDNHKKIVTDRKADYLGVFSGNYAPVRIDGVYGYIDKKMKEHHFEYEYAGPFENGVAAVKKDGKWGLINSSFEAKTGFVYDEILIDNYGFCATYNVFFAKKDGKFNLYDLAGNEIAGGFDDAKQFVSNEPAAVCIDGKWGYISKAGKTVIEPQYADADSFNINLAPVCIKGKWGCIDDKERVIIEPEFDKFLPFSNNGCAYIEKEDFAQMILVDVYK